MGYKMDQKLKLCSMDYASKSLIKNHATLFRVGLSSRLNTTRLHKAQHIEPTT